jgi:hypothetical protein
MMAPQTKIAGTSFTASAEKRATSAPARSGASPPTIQ